MSGRYLLACPSCGASVPSDDVQWDGAEGAPADFGKCPECGATSEADEWVEAEGDSDGVTAVDGQTKRADTPICPPCTHDCNQGRSCPARRAA